MGPLPARRQVSGDVLLEKTDCRGSYHLAMAYYKTGDGNRGKASLDAALRILAFRKRGLAQRWREKQRRGNSTD